jgi:Zn-dependent alcohol dehydrogenase
MLINVVQDLVMQQGEIQLCPYPAVFGHEGAGTIKAIGKGVKNKDLKIGDFVLLSINYCEECKFCKTGHPANCTEGTRLHLFGTRPDGSTTGKIKESGESVRAHFFGQVSFIRQ